MAYDIKTLSGHGDARFGDFYFDSGTYEKINSYARITSINGKVITVDIENAILGEFETFIAGVDVLIHISASFTGKTDKLGNYLTAKIELAERNRLTLDKDVSQLLNTTDLADYSAQIVTIPNFNSVTIGKDMIMTCPVYNPFNHVGGIFILRCFNDLIFEGGVINLVDCGIPANRKTQLRPLHWQETASNGESDVAKYAGAENYMTAERLMLNAGDGLAILMANRIVGDNNSRVGNPAVHGAAFCRGAANSAGVLPSNCTNIGGSTILVAANTIENFTPKMIAKYRDVERVAGRGLCRCLIVSDTKLPNDEGLYSYDVLQDDMRVMRLGVKDFGDGSFGDVANARMCFNNYARVVNIKDGGRKIRYSDKTFTGLAPLGAGSLILAQVIQKRKFTETGRISIARVISDNGTTMILDTPVPNVNLDDYSMQIISIPQFKNYTQVGNFNFTRRFNGIGGVCALACSESLDLRDGQLNVENLGGVAYGREGLKTVGNAQMFDSLPLGEGHGSVFILTKKLILNESSRIGALYSGLGENQLAGYKGAGVLPAVKEFSNGGFVGGGAGVGDMTGLIGGSGYSGGIQSAEYDADKIVGGYGSNSKDGVGKQGAHLMIIADKIEGFTQAAISTGGSGEKNGASSQGGSGYADGNAGGSGGFAFIYCR